ncbi:MAG: hypothetical protein M1822_000249 [Bathelium mastoideum]|nr:MAG: hypothetical protein M1822_000249 [Bathelium mastoideum]
MPGILPMKVIKVGTSAQTRIAQACDRCRSKKIRCDGIRPCCSQCANVGFECKTSDKLSRRAFPRGYTESLEERVRALESEVRELKDLLDEKDEKIDMLSRINPNSSTHHLLLDRRPANTLSPISIGDVKDEVKDEVFKIQQSPYLLDEDGMESIFAGTSSGRTLVEAFKRKLQENGQSCSDIETDVFFTPSPDQKIRSPTNSVDLSPPPRMLSDQLISVFFQEWAPLFPVLYRPNFLALYEGFVSENRTIPDKQGIAQLYLVFGIAALSNNSYDKQQLDTFEYQWVSALESAMMDTSLPTLQCLLLAQIYCIQKADYARLQTYKSVAIGLSHRLGLHQSQKRFALGALTGETRKKVFWTLYTLDCFSAALLGLPKQLQEDDIHCEYPVDVDEEYVTERGFQPTLPGESTKLSAALALFRVSRILSKVLDQNYPASPSHEISLREIVALNDELDVWLNSLAPHLRLQFAQDKPSTNVVCSRAFVLSLAYHYIRSLIHRPAVCTSASAKLSSSVVALAASSKHSIQIIQLLEERKLSFTICLNRDEVLTLCGFGLLFQNQDLESGSKLKKDIQKQLHAVMDLLERDAAPGASQFRQLAEIAGVSTSERLSVDNLDQYRAIPMGDSMSPPSKDTRCSPQKQIKALASRFTAATQKYVRQDPNEVRQGTVPSISMDHIGHPQGRCASQVSLSSAVSVQSESSQISPQSQNPSPQMYNTRQPAPPFRIKTVDSQQQQARHSSLPNLDYFPFASDPSAATNLANRKNTNNAAQPAHPTEWERLLGSIDNGQTNIYDNIYGGPPVDALLDAGSLTHTETTPSSYATLDLPPDSFLPYYTTHHGASHATGASAMSASASTHPYTNSASTANRSSASLHSELGPPTARPIGKRLSADDVAELHNSSPFDELAAQDWGSVSTSSDGCFPGIVMVGSGGEGRHGERHGSGSGHVGANGGGGRGGHVPSGGEELVGLGDGSWWAWVMDSGAGDGM